MTEHLLTAAIGAVVGFASGLFGIGGSLIATPLLRAIVGLSPFLALASPFPSIIPSAASGSYVYAKQKLLDMRVAWITLAAGFPSVVIGSYSTQLISGNALMIVTGIFLVLVGGTFIVRGWLLRADIHEYNPATGRIIIIAIFAGLVAGFLAIGGGIVFVPAYVRLLRMPLKRAIATSLFCVGCFAIPGTIIHASLGHIDWVVALIMAVTVIPVSNLGARVAVTLRSQTLERIYGVFIMSFAIWFIFSQLS